MASKNILIYGDKILRQKCDPVEKIDETILQLIQDMKDTLVEASGAGLAAPQIGSPVRLILVKTSEKNENSDTFVLINPEILKSEGKLESDEGCLSIPGVTETVERFANITVEYMAEDGETNVIDASEFLSRVLQHEIDHLNGILFVDRLGMVRRDMIKRKLKKRFGKKERVKT
ncbi:MAG: peptide deformylase [Candidatus Schekmanbacteria bacterium RBG_13_48_7]|uniref:Peptide deformylase n=1 Tax=Candidatus Schekmanbacteria bacterium RBG_13_48_7 TaxID=1817878 RepID=A0A1F7RZU6_9BACT|nr:MAG: peptide deformylase [Candidatus Schekmanbacteria bacterium RBG_13_48_7]